MKRQVVTVMLERDVALTLSQRVPATVDIRRVLDAVPDDMLLDEVKFRGLTVAEEKAS